MRNVGRWQPSKYRNRSDKWLPSPDPKELAIGSRLIASLAMDHLSEVVRAHASGHLLDLGCGKVPYFGLYNELVSNVTCVDWPQSIHGSAHIDVAADLNHLLPFADQVFDTVLATDVLEHIASPDRMMSEIARILRLDGKLILSVPFFYWLHEGPHDYYRYTEFALRRFCGNVGLSPIHLERYGGAPEIILDILLKHIARLSPMAGRICSWPALRICRLYPVRRISNWLDNFPLGYLLVARKPSAT